MLRTNGLKSMMSLGGSLLVGMMAAASIPLASGNGAAPPPPKLKRSSMRSRLHAKGLAFQSQYPTIKKTAREFRKIGRAFEPKPSAAAAHIHPRRKRVAMANTVAAAFRSGAVRLPEAPADV